MTSRIPSGSSDGHGGFTSDDQVAGGMLLPTTSVEAYGANRTWVPPSC